MTIALAIGDPNGIGPEIAVKAALAGPADARPLLVGDRFVIEHYARMLNARADALAIHDAPTLPRENFAPGKIDPTAGRATVEYVKAALALTRTGAARAIVACPHNETAVNAAGIKFSGYPELLGELHGKGPGHVFMMFCGGGLRIVHATLHERIHDALARLTPDLVVAAALAAVDALRVLGVEKPRIGIFGVNPHAGEGGLFGDDDDRIGAPAAKMLAARGIDIVGPIGADVLISDKSCDAFVAMYHDQGHIPIKLIAGRTASALSIGAGVLFSTVGHGSAFDIAGKGIADPEAVLRTLALLGGVRA